MENRLALVTGASRGIGYAFALELARRGAHVIALARTQGGLDELETAINGLGGTVTLVPCDLTDLKALDRLGAVIHERWGKLDVLVGNAGVLGGLGPVAHVEAKTWERVMTVNVTANWRLIRSMDRLLHAAGAGRCLFLSSGLAHDFRAYWAPYSVSKAALEAIVKTYAAENAATAVNANLLSPGAVRTAMRASAMPGEDPANLTPPDHIARAAVPLCLPSCKSNGAVFDFSNGTVIERKTC